MIFSEEKSARLTTPSSLQPNWLNLARRLNLKMSLAE